MSDEIFFLSPHIVHKVWGGKKLEKMKGLNLGLGETPVGETWEISTDPEGPSRIINSQNKSPLPEYRENLNYLLKLIDSSDDLSVQVHPDDDYAQKHEKSRGKTECWLVLEAEEKSGIYLGLKPGVKREEFEKALKNNGDVSRLLSFYPVSRGDFFYVPAGTIHAIGKGVTLLECQQNSGVTYRVWDWNRTDEKGEGRELHVQKAMDVICFSRRGNSPKAFKRRKNLLKESGSFDLAEHKDFHLKLFSKMRESGELTSSTERPLGIMVLEGKMRLGTEEGEVEVPPYQSLLLCSDSSVTFSPGTDDQEINEVSFVTVS